MLREHLDAFSWNEKKMKGVNSSVCTQPIYIKESCKLVQKSQMRMNQALKDIVKEELQKLLDAGFIYPILNSE